jgi:hypothetical protein
MGTKGDVIAITVARKEMMLHNILNDASVIFHEVLIYFLWPLGYLIQ